MKLAKKALITLGLASTMALTACSGSTATYNTKGQVAKTESKEDVNPVKLDFFYYDGLRVFKPDAEIWKKVQEDTHIELKGVAPTTPGGDSNEQFNLMLASGDIPDIIHASKANIMKSGDKLVIPLEELIAKHAPNIQKYLDENPMVKVGTVGTDGHTYFIPYMPDGAVSEIMFMRKDWLDKFNLPIPKTVEEYEEAIKTFKDKDANGNGKKDEVGYFDRENKSGIAAIFNLYGASFEPYEKDGVIIDDKYTPAFKESVKHVRDLYAQGLIDPEIYTRGKDSRDIMFQQNIGASTVDWAASTAKYQEKYEGEIEGLEWVPVLPPANINGEAVTQYSRSQLSEWGWSISKNCEDPVAAIKLFDYFFTEGGRRLMNFGIEGVTYDMVDGKPILKDEVINGEKSVNAQLTDLGNLQIGYKQDFEYERQWTNELALKGIDEYIKNNVFLNNVANLGLTYTAEELDLISNKQPALKSYTEEMIQKWVLGSEDIESSFDKYLKKSEELGASEILKAQQTAYDRALKK